MQFPIKITLLSALVGIIFLSCSQRQNSMVAVDTTADSTVEVESIIEESSPQPGDSTYHFENGAEIVEWLSTCNDSLRYKDGILFTIAREVPDYADKLISQLNKYKGFIVVDKAGMNVILYDKYGQVEKSYGMACAKNYGTKHKKADSRTPEGFFYVEGKYDSTDWLFTDDNGYTSPKKGQFGPRFIRLKIPGTSQIGIHGTCSPWSIGHRVSHGCIRILNENILELVDLVEVGMPVIVLPGKRDREVNRSEGYDIPYFPTDVKYSMSEAEKRAPIANPNEINSDNSSDLDSIKSEPIDVIEDVKHESEMVISKDSI